MPAESVVSRVKVLGRAVIEAGSVVPDEEGDETLNFFDCFAHLGTISEAVLDAEVRFSFFVA